MAIEISEELNLIWNTIKSEMENNHKMSSTAFETWFKDFRLVKLTDTKIVFSTAIETKRKVIKDKFSDFIKESVENALGSCPEILEIIYDPIIETKTPIFNTILRQTSLPTLAQFLFQRIPVEKIITILCLYTDQVDWVKLTLCMLLQTRCMRIILKCQLFVLSVKTLWVSL